MFSYRQSIYQNLDTINRSYVYGGYVYFLSNGLICNRVMMFAISFFDANCFAALVSISLCHSAVITV